MSVARQRAVIEHHSPRYVYNTRIFLLRNLILVVSADGLKKSVLDTTRIAPNHAESQTSYYKDARETQFTMLLDRIRTFLRKKAESRNRTLQDPTTHSENNENEPPTLINAIREQSRQASTISTTLSSLQDDLTIPDITEDLRSIIASLTSLSINLSHLHDTLQTSATPPSDELTLDINTNISELRAHLDEAEECLSILQRIHRRKTSPHRVVRAFTMIDTRKLKAHLPALALQLRLARVMFEDARRRNRLVGIAPGVGTWFGVRAAVSSREELAPNEAEGGEEEGVQEEQEQQVEVSFPGLVRDWGVDFWVPGVWWVLGPVEMPLGERRWGAWPVEH